MRHLNSITKLFIAVLITLPLASMAQFTIDSIANFRPYDQRGINVFETPKQNDYPFTGIKIKVGAGFTQQFQGLKHESKALNNTGTGVNRLYPLAPGFMTAQANLYLDVQLADGIMLNVSNYMSSRHHNEFWVKGGYLQFDKLPFKGSFADALMKVVTLKVGHMEINYGDAHFRRPDGGHTLYSPFMEGNIMDEFATEIGGEIYAKTNGLIAMVGITNGMIKGNIDSAKATVQDPEAKKSPSIYGKLGYDKQLTEDIRFRVTTSVYHNGNNDGSGLTLFGGDRTGSNYQNVMEKGIPGSLPATTAVAFSGRLNPSMRNHLTAAMFNGFLKVQGFELFGTYEIASGRNNTETSDRKVNQYAVDGVYRLGKTENLYLGLRYNSVKAELAGYSDKVTVNRFAAAAGWFITKNILLKGEIVNQEYLDFPNTDYRNGGKFKGYVIEATVGF